MGLMCLVIYLSYSFFVASDRYTVKKVFINGGLQYASPSDLKTLVEGNVLGVSMFSVDPQNVSKVITDNFMSVKSARIEREFPDSLVINLEERKPIAYVCSITGECFFIDKEAYVLGQVGETYIDLPKINYEGDIFLGDKLSEDIIPVSFEIISEAATNRVNISSISYSPQKFEVFVENRTSVVLGKNRTVAENFKALAELLKRSRLEGKSVKRIDLRYDKAVVSYY